MSTVLFQESLPTPAELPATHSRSCYGPWIAKHCLVVTGHQLFTWLARLLRSTWCSGPIRAQGSWVDMRAEAADRCSIIASAARMSSRVCANCATWLRALQISRSKRDVAWTFFSPRWSGTEFDRLQQSDRFTPRTTTNPARAWFAYTRFLMTRVLTVHKHRLLLKRNFDIPNRPVARQKSARADEARASYSDGWLVSLRWSVIYNINHHI